MEKKQTYLAYGAVTGLVSVIVNFTIYHTGLERVTGMAYLSYLPVAVGITMNAMAYAKANGGNVTFANVFGSGFKAAAIATLLMVLYIVICIYSFPNMKDKYMEIASASMAKNPQLTDEMIASSLEMMRKGYVPMMIIFTGGYTLLAGFLFSLIGAGIAKKNPDAGGVI